MTRAGRCAVNLRFGKLDRTAAELWAAKHGMELPAGRDFALSDLFALSEGRSVETTNASIGFAPNRR